VGGKSGGARAGGSSVWLAQEERGGFYSVRGVERR
jgi:hypothetical protein